VGGSEIEGEIERENYITNHSFAFIRCDKNGSRAGLRAVLVLVSERRDSILSIDYLEAKTHRSRSRSH